MSQLTHIETCPCGEPWFESLPTWKGWYRCMRGHIFQEADIVRVSLNSPLENELEDQPAECIDDWSGTGGGE